MNGCVIQTRAFAKQREIYLASISGNGFLFLDRAECSRNSATAVALIVLTILLLIAESYLAIFIQNTILKPTNLKNTKNIVKLI